MKVEIEIISDQKFRYSYEIAETKQTGELSLNLKSITLFQDVVRACHDIILPKVGVEPGLGIPMDENEIYKNT